MASSSAESALRQILDQHLAQISEEMERQLATLRAQDQREFAALREHDRQEFAELLERERQQVAESRERERLAAETLERERHEFAESREHERQQVAESRERERLAAETLERERHELAESLEQERQQVAELRERERLAAETLERERHEFAESLEQERQQVAESRERERIAVEALERERHELAESLEHERQQVAESRERERLAVETLERERHEFAELREHDQQEFAESLGRERQEFANSRERERQLVAELRKHERREFADRLNQAVRRIRQSGDWEELSATLVDAAAVFSGGAAWLRVADGTARGGPIRGVPEEAEERFRSLEIPLADAAALAGAVESRDPVIAAIAEGQVSAALLSLPGHPTEGRVAIFPLVTKDGVPGLLYTWGDGQEAVLEMVTQVASAAWEILTPPPPPPAPELVRISAVPVPVGKPARSAWEQLSAEEQQIHLRAQRYARVQAAEMRLHEADAVESGRARRNLYDVLQKPIDQARTTFHQKFFMACPSMVDYLHLELVRTLANDDAELLGTDYPGPLV
ncbi:MAG: hypothetical protein ACLQU1_32845 [Bryobacteraceae bacterium]